MIIVFRIVTAGTATTSSRPLDAWHRTAGQRQNKQSSRHIHEQVEHPFRPSGTKRDHYALPWDDHRNPPDAGRHSPSAHLPVLASQTLRLPRICPTVLVKTKGGVIGPCRSISSPNVPSDLSLLASGIRACSAGEMPEVPEA